MMLYVGDLFHLFCKVMAVILFYQKKLPPSPKGGMNLLLKERFPPSPKGELFENFDKILTA